MRIVESYILKRVFILFSAVMIASVAVAWTVRILAQVNFLITSGQTFLMVLYFSSLLIPSVIPPLIPASLMIAIIAVFSAMNQNSELVIINAAGMPKSTVWKPILLLAIMASFLSFLTSNFVVPQARLSMRQTLENAHARLISFVMREGNFQELTNNLYIEIGTRNPNGTIQHLFIADQRNPKIDLFYYATSGAIIRKDNSNLLVLKNGEIERINHTNNGVSIIKFSTYAFNLSEFTPATETTTHPKEKSLTYLLNPKKDEPNYKQEPLRYNAELHRRLTEWLYPIVFALISVIVAGNVHPYRKKGQISSNVSAMAFSFLIYWIAHFLSEKIKSNPSYIPLLYGIPIGISTFIFFMLLTDRRIKRGAKLHHAVQVFFQKMMKSI